MSIEEIAKEITKIACVLGQGLDMSNGAVGLTRQDSEMFTTLRDSAVYALALLRISESKLKMEVKACEDVDEEADVLEKDVSGADAD